ncbi:hypothetical protein SUDANB176_00022 [Streptomyces sp. enrichment culture]
MPGAGAGRWCYGHGRDENEQRLVRRLSRARKAPRDLVLRARMVELSRPGERVPTIADELRCSPKTVRRWLHRFNRLGLDALEDPGGQGRKRRITESERSQIIGLVGQPTPGRLTDRADGELAAADESGPPEWTLDALAAGEASDRRISWPKTRLPGLHLSASPTRQVGKSSVSFFKVAADRVMGRKRDERGPRAVDRAGRSPANGLFVRGTKCCSASGISLPGAVGFVSGDPPGGCPGGQRVGDRLRGEMRFWSRTRSRPGHLSCGDGPGRSPGTRAGGGAGRRMRARV